MDATRGKDWPQVGRDTTVTEQVYQELRLRLVAGDFAPETFIRELDVGKAMGVSRTPVREALNRLASEGFVERIPQRGFRVPAQSIENLVHLYPVLGALEVLAGDLAFPRLTESDLDELEEVNRKYAEALQANDVNAAVEWNEEFHRRLSQLSDNPILCEMLDQLRAQIRRLEVWDFSHQLVGTPEQPPSRPPDKWAKQHAAVLEAVRAGEFVRARELLHANRSLVFQEEMKQLKAHRRRPSAHVRSALQVGG